MISVLLPVRNGAATLDAALRSIQEQTLSPQQCVAIDDGSTDSTAEILKSWQRRWPALEVKHLSGAGIAQALNAGIESCRMPWIARMDADDLAYPARFERQLELASTNSSLKLISCLVRHPTQDGTAGMAKHIAWANTKTSHEELELALWIDSPLPHPTWLVQRELFNVIGCYDGSGDIPEDYEWLHRFFAAARQRNDIRAGKTNEELLEWADSPGRLTRTHAAYSEKSFNKVKAKALRTRIPADAEIFIFGLGPKGKELLPELLEQFPSGKIRAAVDVNSRRTGQSYMGVEVWDIDAWKLHRKNSRTASFALLCLGTAETRVSGEAFCIENGLRAGTSFLSL